ncbi:MAG: TatD family hydrolase [Idiomarina sp.]|nr:TatD family hydrolase [Idiomarina sp.]
MQLFDTHCHLDFEAFDKDRGAVLKRAREAGIERFMVPGVTRNQWDKLVPLASDYSCWYYALGLHPWFIDEHKDSDVEELERQLEKQQGQVRAVGEIGLDRTCPNFDKQHRLFIRQLELAKCFKLPVIIHHRKTLDRTHADIKKYGPENGVIHAFSGSHQQAMKFVEQGYKLGVGGVITYERAQKTRQAIKEVPIESLVLETDSPDMPLSGYQGQRNEPSRVPLVLEALAKLRNTSEEELASQLWQNSVELFR